MGYTTDFTGQFTITPALSEAQATYINKFSETRRFQRDITKTGPDPLREAVGLPAEAPYFVGIGNRYADDYHSPATIDYNEPPAGQPGLWCQWVVVEDGTKLEWDGGEKFYDYVEWLEYLMEHFFSPWGCTIAGEVHWQGEESNDRGTIYAKDNKIAAVAETINNAGPEW